MPAAALSRVRLSAQGDPEPSPSCPLSPLQQSPCSGRSRGCGRRCRWPSWASSPRRPRPGRAWSRSSSCPGPADGREGGTGAAPSRKLNSRTDGQPRRRTEPAPRAQPRESGPSPFPVAQPPRDSRRHQRPRTWTALRAQLSGGDTSGGQHPRPRVRDLLPAGACGCWAAWCPGIAKPSSQALRTSAPLWPSLSPSQWTCPQGSGAKDFHASWNLLENCLQVPPMDKGPRI